MVQAQYLFSYSELFSMLPCISLAKWAIIISDEWATASKLDDRANAHPGLPLATPLFDR